MRNLLIGGLMVGVNAANGACLGGDTMLTFTPLTATNIVIQNGESATVKYMVTNDACRPKGLTMRQIAGVTQNTANGNCPNPFPLRQSQSCVLELTINGSNVVSVSGGPVICAGSVKCYQPSQANSLNIIKK